MPSKKQIIIVLVLCVVSAAVGRYLTPEKIKIETKIVEVESKTKDKNKQINDHKKTTIVETTAPDGTKTKTTVITDDRNSSSSSSETDNKHTETDTSKEVVRGSSKVTLSALVAMNTSSLGTPIYGLSITKPVLGPLTLGIFGLTDKVGGVSVGLTF